MFIAAMSTIAKLWKEARCPSTDEWIKKKWCIYIYIYNGILCSHQKMKSCHLRQHGWNWRYYAKQNKSVRERQLSYDLAHMWNLRNKT